MLQELAEQAPPGLIFKMDRLVCSLPCGVLVSAPEAEGCGPLHRGLPVRGGGLGPGGAAQQTDHRGDFGGDLPTVRYGALPASLHTYRAPGWVGPGERVGGCLGVTTRRTLSLTLYLKLSD